MSPIPTTTNIFKHLAKREFLYSIIVCLIILLCISSSFAQTVPVTNGLNWLTAAQNIDGSWGQHGDLLLLNTSTVVDTLKIGGNTGTYYNSAVAWISAQSTLFQ